MDIIQKRSAVDLAFEQILEYLHSDAVSVGDKLPSEKTMCNALGISRTTIREAYRKLQSLGYIEILNGKGSFVKSKDIGLVQESLDSLKSSRAIIGDYLEVRMALDPLAAQLAARSRKAEDIKTLRQLHEEFIRAYERNDSKAMAAIDASLHMTIVNMTNNDLLIALIRIVNFYFELLREQSFMNHDHASNAIGPHSKIIEAIASSDYQAAAQESMMHIKMAMKDFGVN